MADINEVLNLNGSLTEIDREDYKELTDKMEACTVLIGALFMGVNEGYTPEPAKAIQLIETQMIELHRDMETFFDCRRSSDCRPLQRIGG